MDRRSLSLAAFALSAALAAPAAAVGAPGDTTLVNRSPMGSGDAWGDAFGHAISADGQKATFISADGRYVFDDGADYDVFVRDLGKGTTAAFGGELGSQTHDLSADGRWLTFASSSRSIEQEREEDPDLYLTDLQAVSDFGRTTNIGHLKRGEGTQSGPHSPAISADGGRVVFESSTGVISLYDRASDTGRILERYRNERDCFDPQISGDGNVVAYNCTWSEGDRSKSGLYVWDLREPAPRRIGNGAEPRLSADGRLLVWGTFETARFGVPDDTAFDVVITDLETGQTELLAYLEREVGRGYTVIGGSPAAVSADGRFVAFTALARDPTYPDSTCCATPVVLDRTTGHVEPVARPDGADGPVSGGWAVDMTPDGRFVLFDSDNPALDAQKTGERRTVYVREMPVRGAAQAPAPIGETPGGPGAPSTPGAPGAPSPAPAPGTPPAGAVPGIGAGGAERSVTGGNGLTLRLAPALTLDRRGRVAVTVRNTTTRTLTARVQLRAGGRTVGMRTVRLRPRAAAQVRVTLTRAARRRLASMRTQRVSVIASHPGATAVTRTTVTLRRR